MPLLWDIVMAVVTGFATSSLKPVVYNFLGLNLSNKILFIIGLAFTQLVIVTISVWCWVDVDPDWLMLYLGDPAILGSAVQFIYAMFPFYYGVAYAVNAKLISVNKGRYAYLVGSTTWLGLTAWFTFFDPNHAFITLFKDNPAYGPQFIWYLQKYPSGNALWFFPVDYQVFFIIFFLAVVFLLGLHEGLAIAFARTDFYKDAPSQPPSRFLIFMTGLMFDISNRMIIHGAKKDYRLRQLVKSFKATIQNSTKDGLIERYLIFDGKGGIVYGKGKVAIDEKDPTYCAIIFRSVRDLFIMISTWGDVVEGLVEHRFEPRGNLSVLYKFQLLSNYINPTKKLVEGSRLPIIDEKKSEL